MRDTAAERFWRRDQTHIDQKFYSGFCILMSACLDYATGIDLYAQRKLNWAATTMYYSMIHSGRLVCLLSVGDFPTGHSQLGQLFARGETRGGTWLNAYKRKRFIDLRNEDFENSFALSEIHQAFITMGADPTDMEEALTVFSTVLPAACELRNDSNYEGLLIAHQYAHRTITEDFYQLAATFSKACNRLIPRIADMFQHFVCSSPRRDAWCAFLNWKAEREGLYYLEDSLQARILSSRAMHVLRCLEPLRNRPDLHVHLAQEVHRNIAASTFGVKSDLMKDFRKNIAHLKKQIGKQENVFHLALDEPMDVD